MEENRKSRATPSDVQRHRLDDTLMVGRLTAHGPAPYQFRRGGDPSYFVKVLTQRGERVVWGKDLRRAVQESMTAVVVGDLIGVQRTGRDPVTLASHRSAAVGRDSQQSQPPAYRNRWVVEKAAFFAERARLARQLRDEQLDVSAAVRERPELKSTFLTLRAAREFAKKRVKDPRDQERFMSLVKEAIEGSIRRGEPMPTVKLRQDARTTALRGVKAREPTR